LFIRGATGTGNSSLGGNLFLKRGRSTHPRLRSYGPPRQENTSGMRCLKDDVTSWRFWLPSSLALVPRPLAAPLRDSPYSRAINPLSTQRGSACRSSCYLCLSVCLFVCLLFLISCYDGPSSDFIESSCFFRFGLGKRKEISVLISPPPFFRPVARFI
jgi:hypothetical protein